MRKVPFLVTLFCLQALIYMQVLQASVDNNFKIIPESVHVYKGQIKSTDNLLIDVSIVGFVATKIEAGENKFVSVVATWEPISGLFYWVYAPYPDHTKPELVDVDGKQFNIAAYLANENIYISKIGIASWDLSFRGWGLWVRGSSDRANSLEAAKDAVLLSLNETNISQAGQHIHTFISLAIGLPDTFLIGTRPCGTCPTRAKLTSVRVVDDKWTISISGGYQTDAELEFDKNFVIRKICIRPSTGQAK